MVERPVTIIFFLRIAENHSFSIEQRTEHPLCARHCLVIGSEEEMARFLRVGCVARVCVYVECVSGAHICWEQ